jgi:thiamine-monophosphate kinase
LARFVKKPPGEFELIARLVRGLPMSRRTALGPGDDCAILAPSRAPRLFTIDSMVEDVHFRLGWGTPEKLGAKSLAVNLSDIAAMGGRPTACVVNLAVRAGLDMRFFERLYAGMRSLARATKVDIVGGNVTRADKLGITVALLGEVGAAAMRRDSARPGDEIFVTGTLGDSALGLRILAGKLSAPGKTRRALVERHLSPTARLAAGLALARMRPVPTAIDISDGLVQDLGHIAERSEVGAEIDATQIPVSKEYRTVMGDDLSLALGGGEDYELLFCLRPGRSEAELGRRLGVQVRRIGTIVRGRRVLVRNARGRTQPEVAGWDQLRGRL